MTLISQSYREQNAKLHSDHDTYGAGVATKFWYALVDRIAEAVGAASILDYGCGKNRLASTLTRHVVMGYDPAIPGFDLPPSPADLVVCMDVLEHIEPDCLDAVLDDLQRLALKGVFLTIATGAALRVLPDGRNAHLIQEGPAWWLPKILQRWPNLQMMQARNDAPEFAVYAFSQDFKGGKK